MNENDFERVNTSDEVGEQPVNKEALELMVSEASRELDFTKSLSEALKHLPEESERIFEQLPPADQLPKETH